MMIHIWKTWSKIIIWLHIASLLGVALVYGIISFAQDVPFDEIFSYPETGTYYLLTYVFILVGTISLCGVGVVFGDVFGHRDLRGQLVTKGLIFIGTLGSLLPLVMITMWEMVLNNSSWIEWANGAQHFGIWLVLTLTVIYAFVWLILFFLGKELSQIPDGWAYLSLGLACLTSIVALSCFWISTLVIVFRVLVLIDAIGYLVWAIWFSQMIDKLDRMH